VNSNDQSSLHLQDFPRRTIYWMTDDKSLHVKIEGHARRQPASEEWT